MHGGEEQSISGFGLKNFKRGLTKTVFFPCYKPIPSSFVLFFF
jgi:hypothetical protein